jgi:transposase
MDWKERLKASEIGLTGDRDRCLEMVEVRVQPLRPEPPVTAGARSRPCTRSHSRRPRRALLIEIAWTWLRYQPGSALAKWFDQRTQGTGPNRRARRIAIVVVARRLAIALWRYLKDGVIPEGAHFKSA